MSSRDTFVLRTAEERGIRFVRLWFVDVLGILKGLSVPVSELETVIAGGVGIDGSSLEGGIRTRERDLIATPDLGTFGLLPWKENEVARVFCAIHEPAGDPFAADSRAVLSRVLDAAAEAGWTAQVGAEIEFYLLADGSGADEPRLLDQGAYFDLTPLDEGSEFRGRTIGYLEQLGIPVKASHHEVGPSQHEIQLAHTDALSMADAITTFRLAVKEVASELDVFATFMPKPFAAHSGSGMHLHLSLFEGDRNAFWDPDAEQPLSPLGRMFAAGVLAHAPELTMLSNQWVNSYKRLSAGFEAPSRIIWTREAGEGLLRVPSARPERAAAARLELRSPDPAANPYLLIALTIAAGLRGIERGYELGVEDGGGEVAEAPLLPQDLREATGAFERSELVRETLGEALVETLVANKRAEWEEFMSTVSSWELRRFLRTL